MILVPLQFVAGPYNDCQGYKFIANTALHQVSLLQDDVLALDQVT